MHAYRLVEKTVSLCMENIEFGTDAQFCRYLLLGRSFVADQVDDQILRVFRDLP